jgi:hypothetical protein
LSDRSKGNGLRVIIDGSPNSLPPELKTTTREFVIDVDLMERKELESIDEFKGLISILRKYQLDIITRTVTILLHEPNGVLVDNLKKNIRLHMIKQLECVIKSSEKNKGNHC